MKLSETKNFTSDELLDVLAKECSIDITEQQKELLEIKVEESYMQKDKKRFKYYFKFLINVPFFDLTEKKRTYSYVVIENDAKNEFLVNCQEPVGRLFLDFQIEEFSIELKGSLHYINKLLRLKEKIINKEDCFDFRMYQSKNLHYFEKGVKKFNLGHLVKYLKIDEINERLCYQYDDNLRTVFVYPNLQSELNKKDCISVIPLFPSISNVDFFFQDIKNIRIIVEKT